MPYDPRSVREGGNRGIDKEFSRKAPQGNFRVIGVDTFDATDWLEGDFATIDDAKAHAEKETHGKQMLKMHIYNDKGRHVEAVGAY